MTHYTGMRAKFYVYSIMHYTGGHSTLELWPVHSNDPLHENKRFWDATPSGKITLTVKTEIVKDFSPGDEYYIDFTLSESVPHE